jgi:methylenetetrahydrofolate dehydrogenase (NADP+)/methenyltetrahydrofolate cyclohydrolase
MELISGKDFSNEIRSRLKETNTRDGLQPCIAIMNVGDDKENLIYIGLKENAVDAMGGKTRIVNLPIHTEKQEILDQIAALNQDAEVDGILFQLPLPDKLKPYQEEFLTAIDPDKDVDGFHPVNMGRLMGGNPVFVSCAALACMDISQRYAAPLAGKKVLLVGDSFDVIQPLALMFTQAACQVLIAPKYKPALMGDIDIAVIEKGGPNIVKVTGIKEGALIIDAGFYYEQTNLYGNIDKESLAGVKGHLLPVPGGMGPILIAKLLENLSQAARKRMENN